MRSLGLALLATAPCVSAVAEGVYVDPDRRALFQSILEENGCRLHEIYPAQDIKTAMAEHKFDPKEVRAIGRSLVDTGKGERTGDFLVLTTEKCR